MNSEKLDVVSVKQLNMFLVMHEHHPPLESSKPKAGVPIGLVFADHDRMRDRQ